MKHKTGAFESTKFDFRRKDFREYLKHLREMKIPLEEVLEHYSAYAGHMSINRLITLYEMYKMVSSVAGHIAEVGVYKGAGTLLFAKLVHIFENEALTQVHGFDWFEGTGKPTDFDSDLVPVGSYNSSHDELLELIELQKLDHIIRIHKLDLTKDLADFLDQHPHLQFKLIFFDSGRYDVMTACLPLLWDRLTPGGVAVFDQYNHDLSPGETLALREALPNFPVKTIQNSWHPNAFIVKAKEE